MYNFSSSCVYTCQNGLLGNYSEENGVSVPPNSLPQSNMVSSIDPMSLDLYGLTITPPPGGRTSSPPSHSTQTPSDLTSPIDTIPSSLNKEEQNSHVIYPWMRKVHINNAG
jgi:hypothetical protein